MDDELKTPLILDGLTVWFDVDDTLIFWRLPKNYKGPKVKVKHYEGEGMFAQNFTKTFAINTAAVDALKVYKKNGHNIVVWSAGGCNWAREVVYALGLRELVDVIVDKPTLIFDDLSADEWMPTPLSPMPKHWSLQPSGAVYYPMPENPEDDEK